MWRERPAHVLPEGHQEVVVADPVAPGKLGAKRQLRLVRRLGPHEPEAVRDAVDVDVDADAGLVEPDGDHEVRGLSPHPFEREQRAYDVFIGVPPHRAPAIVRDSGLTAGDWIRPDPHSCATSWPGVFAVGDVTEMPLANGMMLPKAGVFAEAQGRVAADGAASFLAGGDGKSTFDGRGYCFVETGEGMATAIQGNFFASPQPAIEVAMPSPEVLAQKREFEASRLAAWFP